MEAYTSFAYVYDTFMDNVPYEEWADYLRTWRDRRDRARPRMRNRNDDGTACRIWIRYDRGR